MTAVGRGAEQRAGAREQASAVLLEPRAALQLGLEGGDLAHDAVDVLRADRDALREHGLEQALGGGELRVEVREHVAGEQRVGAGGGRGRSCVALRRSGRAVAGASMRRRGRLASPRGGLDRVGELRGEAEAAAAHDAVGQRVGQQARVGDVAAERLSASTSASDSASCCTSSRSKPSAAA